MIIADANVVLELLLPGRAAAKVVADYVSRQEAIHVTVLTCHIVWYFGRRDGIDDELIKATLGLFKVAEDEPADYYWALKNERGRDFEDTLQIAAAIRSGADTFVTLDADLVKAYQGYTTMRIINPTAAAH